MKELFTLEFWGGLLGVIIAIVTIYRFYIAYLKENSGGKTAVASLKVRVEELEREVEVLKRDNDRTIKELDAIDEKMDNILFDLIKKM